MDDSDLDALIRRINGWVESRIAKEIINHEQSTFSIQEAVKQGKIILLDNDLYSDSIQRLMAVAIVRGVWRAALTRPEDERVPYFLLIDELDDILSDEMRVDEMVRNARKYKLSMILMTQYLGALDNEDVEEAIDEQCTTVITHRLTSTSNSEAVAKMHDIDDGAVIRKLTRHHAVVEIEIDGDPKGPIEMNCFPPYPPVRTMAEARSDIIEPSLERYGVERKDDEDTHHPAPNESTRTQIQGLRAAYDTSIRQGSPGGPIAIADTLDKLNDYAETAFTDPDTAWREIYQDIPETQIDYKYADDDDDEPSQIIVKDRPWLTVGTSPTSGGKDHQSTMADAYIPLTQLGFVVEVLDQSDGEVGEPMPDAIARLDDVLDLDHIDDPGVYADEVNSFRESDEYALLVRLAGTKDAYIESEHTTTGTQPSQAVKNAIEAHKDGHRCLFLCRPELAEKLYSYLADHPKGCSSQRSTDSEDHYYTKSGTALSIDGEDMTRNGTEKNFWYRDIETGQYILRDDSGTEHARFDTPTEIFNDASAYPDGGEQNVLPPVIPDHELNGDSMDDIEWDIIVVPHRHEVDPEYDPDEDDEPRELTPLDLKLYQHNAENIRLIDLDTTNERQSTQPTVDINAVDDAIDNAAGRFNQND